MNLSFHGSGFEKARRQVLIIELAAVLAPFVFLQHKPQAYE
jgi:hypothetical protein